MSTTMTTVVERVPEKRKTTRQSIHEMEVTRQSMQEMEVTEAEVDSYYVRVAEKVAEKGKRVDRFPKVDTDDDDDDGQTEEGEPSVKRMKRDPLTPYEPLPLNSDRGQICQIQPIFVPVWIFYHTTKELAVLLPACVNELIANHRRTDSIDKMPRLDFTTPRNYPQKQNFLLPLQVGLVDEIPTIDSFKDRGTNSLFSKEHGDSLKTLMKAIRKYIFKTTCWTPDNQLDESNCKAAGVKRFRYRKGGSYQKMKESVIKGINEDEEIGRKRTRSLRFCIRTVLPSVFKILQAILSTTLKVTPSQKMIDEYGKNLLEGAMNIGRNITLFKKKRGNKQEGEEDDDDDGDGGDDGGDDGGEDETLSSEIDVQKSPNQRGSPGGNYCYGVSVLWKGSIEKDVVANQFRIYDCIAKFCHDVDESSRDKKVVPKTSNDNPKNADPEIKHVQVTKEVHCDAYTNVFGVAVLNAENLSSSEPLEHMRLLASCSNALNVHNRALGIISDYNNVTLKQFYRGHSALSVKDDTLVLVDANSDNDNEMMEKLTNTIIQLASACHYYLTSIIAKKDEVLATRDSYAKDLLDPNCRLYMIGGDRTVLDDDMNIRFLDLDFSLEQYKSGVFAQLYQALYPGIKEMIKEEFGDSMENIGSEHDKAFHSLLRKYKHHVLRTGKVTYKAKGKGKGKGPR